jgi:arsenite-transporting ATPase
MEEQLSGSCTVEIAAFNAFSDFMTNKGIANEYDHIVFDTAPTGHTLRMLELPSAWNDFLDHNTSGASCLGQLSGLQDKKQMYENAVKTLSDAEKTTLLFITRPEESPLAEAARASLELGEIGIHNQILIVNGVLQAPTDAISTKLYEKQQKALSQMPPALNQLNTYAIPLRAYNIMGVEAIRAFLTKEEHGVKDEGPVPTHLPELQEMIEDLYAKGKKVIFTMGKGGVGKTTLAAAIAKGLANKGCKVHLTTTDPAAHLHYVIGKQEGITMSHIDEKEELEKYRQEVLAKAKHLSQEDIAYIEEDLRSPCTQEIAVFRAFAKVVGKAEKEVVVIDTAPTGHTLLLLDSTQSYHQEIKRSQGEVPDAVKKLLPRLRNEKETEVVIVTLAETTPVYEAMRLEEDLKRAGIYTNWWVINASFYGTNTTHTTLKAKASSEVEWINKIDAHTKGKFVLIPWGVEQNNKE